MVTASFLKLSALSGALGALMLGVPGLIEIVTGEIVATSLVIGVSVGPLVALLPGVHLYQSLARAGAQRVSGAPSPTGECAYLANLVGLGLFGAAGYLLNVGLFLLDDVLPDDGPAGPTKWVLLGSALVFVAGTVAYGLFLIRSRVFALPVAGGYTVLLPVLAVAAGLPDSPLTGLLHGLVAAVLVAMATQIWCGADKVVAAGAGGVPSGAQPSLRSPGGLAP